MEDKDCAGVQNTTKHCLDSFYEDATIFVTGATGFLGKLLVRKLLATFPKIKKIYVLVRTKNEVTADTRIKEYCEQKIFNGLLTLCPDFPEKIRGVCGDASHPRLGLSEDDIFRLKDEVQIVFHGAANVRFKDSLKSSLSVNTQGVVELLNICQDMENLKCIIQVSTAFSHGHLRNTPIKEEVMKSGINYKSVLQLLEFLDDDILTRISPALLDNWPNIYMFTKYLGEQIVGDSHLPVGIFRPGVVMATYRDPVKGWTDNLYVVLGVTVLVLSGTVRCLKINPKLNSYIIPADWCVNALIAAAPDVSENYRSKSNPRTMVYNYCSADSPLSWEDMNKAAQKSLKYPLKNAIWVPMLIFCTTNWGYKTAQFFLHFLPAFFVDAFLFVTGRQPKLIKTYKKIHKRLEDLVISSPWLFETENIHKLWEKLDSKDQQRLPFHMPNLQWEDYFEYFLKGVGKHMMGQMCWDLAPARTRYVLFKTLNTFLIYLLIGLAVLIVWKVLMAFI